MRKGGGERGTPEASKTRKNEEKIFDRSSFQCTRRRRGKKKQANRRGEERRETRKEKTRWRQ